MPDTPLDEHVGYATHLIIRCRCSHETIMLTSELYRLLPRARTWREFRDKLVCKKCGLRGWASIMPAGRG